VFCRVKGSAGALLRVLKQTNDLSAGVSSGAILLVLIITNIILGGTGTSG